MRSCFIKRSHILVFIAGVLLVCEVCFIPRHQNKQTNKNQQIQTKEQYLKIPLVKVSGSKPNISESLHVPAMRNFLMKTSTEHTWCHLAATATPRDPQ